MRAGAKSGGVDTGGRKRERAKGEEKKEEQKEGKGVLDPKNERRNIRTRSESGDKGCGERKRKSSTLVLTVAR